MGNKRLKKRAYSLKGLSRRGLSLLMAMVMTLSLVQISAFAEEDVAETPKDPLTPDPISLKDNAKYDNHDITLSKTAQRVGDTEWEVTVKADIGETEIKQQPLEVVFVIDRSGSMNWCAKDEHGQGSHEHEKNYEVLYQGEWYERIGWEHTKFLSGRDNHPKTEYENGKFNPTLCPDYKHDPCTKAEVKHGERGSDNLCVPCQYKDSDGKWQDYETRMEATKTAVGKLVSSLPKGTEVTYVSYTTKGWNWNRPDIDVSKDLNSLNLTPTGNTNTNEGMEVGIEQFKSNVSKKVLVLLTDGEVSENYTYTSDNYDGFDGAVYVVGFAFSNDALADVPKNGGTFAYAKNTTDLENSFTELATRISAMIVDPMGNDVTYVSGSVQDKGKTAGTISVDGNTLRWIPKDKEKFSNSTIEYTYRVSLRPQQEAGRVENIALNNTTYLQYGVTKGEETKKFEAEFPIPKGYYKVSTLEEQFKVLDENGNASDITDSLQKPQDFQSKVTDYGMTDLKVYAPIQALDTNNEHVKYVYQYSKLDDDDINVRDAEGNITLDYIEPYDGNTINVTDKAEAHTLVHYYAKEYVNSITYEYTGEVPEDLNAENEDMLGTQWYPQGSEQTKAGEPTSGKYNFSGWTVKSGNVEFKENGTFDLTDDVVFEGSWTIKPSYRVEAYYYTCVDGKPKAEPDNKDAISLTGTVYVDEDGDVQYTIQPDDYKKYDGQTMYDYEVAVAPGSTCKLEKGSEVVTDITPSQETTTVTLNFYRNTKTPVEYTVTHEYYNVDPDDKETLVDANTAVDTYRGEHEETIQAADVPAKNVDTYTETGRSPESIQLNKNAEAKANITITYKHYEYRVTVTGDAGVTAINGDNFTYSKGKNGSVNFKLKPGYKLASVTDQAGTDEPKAVTASADVNGVYSYSIRNIQANHHVDIKTEQIPYTLTVKYEFSDKSTHDGFDTIVKNDYFYGQDYKAEQKAAPAGYHFVEATGDPAEGKIKKNTEVTFHYAKNGDGTVIVNYLKEGTNEELNKSVSVPGTIGTAYDLSSAKNGEKYVVKSITKDYVVYDLVSEPNMTGTFQEKTVIDLYYKERDKNSVVVKYQSESNDPKFALAADVMEKTYTDYVGKNYDVSGNEYVPEIIVDKAGNTWYRSGASFDVNHDKLTGTITKSENGQPIATITIKYYLKPTYSITATYTTVTDGTPSSDSRSSGKQTGDVDAPVPFNRAAYDNYSGFTFNDFVSNSLKVNGNPVSEMPKMEKFQNYDVTLEYRKTVNNPKSTTLNHVFFTVLDNGPETKDEDKTLTETIQVTHGQSANMEEYAKKGAGYEGYKAERYSYKDKMLPAGGNGTIEYVRHMVTVVFDLNDGTWKDSQDDVNYTVVKGTGLNDQ